MKASAELIKSRTGGVIKFRRPVDSQAGIVGTQSEQMMRNQLCNFCCDQRTSEQVCTARGMRGRKKEDTQWAWICPSCKDKLL